MDGYYRAGIHTIPFSEYGAIETINSCVRDNTDGMIKHIVEEVSPGDGMLLMNAISFSAK